MSTRAILGDAYPYITPGSILAWTYGLYYSALDWQLGIPSFVFLTSYAHITRKVYLHSNEFTLVSQSQFVQLAISVHIICWLAQFYGHAVHEKRAPALADNLLQAVVLAPFFVVFEVAFWMGFKLDTKKNMDNKAGKLVLEMNQARKTKAT